MSHSWHIEPHFSQRNNWLRASVLGANDGLISTASLLIGLAAARPDASTILITGVAALVGGAVSMAAGEYVSVSSQADTEKSDLIKEARELERNPDKELAELTRIYEGRGLNADLAHEVAVALTAHNALEAHARDEIGITDTMSANPLQAAAASALAFCSGAILPVLVAIFSPAAALMPTLAASTLAGLGVLGYASAKLGGAPVKPALVRVLLWGAVALASTVGSKNWPAPSSARCFPPVTTLAPLATASSRWRCTLSTAAGSINGPWFTPSSKPLPTFAVFTRAANLATKASYTPACT